MTKRLLAAAALALLPTSLFAADDFFKTATPAELAMKDVAIAPGASAVILDWVQHSDDANQRSAEYVRIKVLKDEGKKYGDISITHVPLLTNLEKIKARVTKPDGLVAVFEHNPLNPLTRRVVRSCAFDEGVELIGRRELEQLFRAAGLIVADSEYLLFFPWRADALERRLTRLPLGAQHVVTGRPCSR